MTTKTPTAELTKPVGKAEPVEIPPEPSTLEEFIEHQRKAFDEAREAVLSLIPQGVRTHSENAIRESVEGYHKLVNNTLDDIIDSLRKVKFEPPRPPKGKTS